MGLELHLPSFGDNNCLRLRAHSQSPPPDDHDAQEATFRNVRGEFSAGKDAFWETVPAVDYFLDASSNFYVFFHIALYLLSGFRLMFLCYHLVEEGRERIRMTCGLWNHSRSFALENLTHQCMAVETGYVIGVHHQRIFKHLPSLVERTCLSGWEPLCVNHYPNTRDSPHIFITRVTPIPTLPYCSFSCLARHSKRWPRMVPWGL